MRDIIKHLMVSILFLSASFAHVRLDYPVGGEIFPQDTTITIEWTILVDHPQENWDLLYSENGGTNWVTLRENIPTSTLSYRWTITQRPTLTGHIKIIQDNVGNVDYSDVSAAFSIVEATTSLRHEIGIPKSLSLVGNYPNPFNPSTRIEYELAHSAEVQLAIYDLKGRQIKILTNGFNDSGAHHVMWDGRNNEGDLMATGVYLARLESEGHSEVIKLALLK